MTFSDGGRRPVINVRRVPELIPTNQARVECSTSDVQYDVQLKYKYGWVRRLYKLTEFLRKSAGSQSRFVKQNG